MAEYIEREAALNESVEVYHWCGYEDRYGDFVPTDAIKRIPAADVAPVVHGKWEFDHVTETDKFAVVKCSNCGHEAFAMAFYVKEGNYCPNCGAKMDGEPR